MSLKRSIMSLKFGRGLKVGHDQLSSQISSTLDFTDASYDFYALSVFTSAYFLCQRRAHFHFPCVTSKAAKKSKHSDQTRPSFLVVSCLLYGVSFCPSVNSVLIYSWFPLAVYRIVPTRRTKCTIKRLRSYNLSFCSSFACTRFSLPRAKQNSFNFTVTSIV